MPEAESRKWGGHPREPYQPFLVIERDEFFEILAFSYISRVRFDSDKRNTLVLEASPAGNSSVSCDHYFKAKSGRTEDLDDLMALRLFFANAMLNQDKTGQINSDNWPKSSDIPLLQSMLAESQALLIKGAPAPAKRQIAAP